MLDNMAAMNDTYIHKGLVIKESCLYIKNQKYILYCIIWIYLLTQMYIQFIIV